MSTSEMREQAKRKVLSLIDAKIRYAFPAADTVVINSARRIANYLATLYLERNVLLQNSDKRQGKMPTYKSPSGNFLGKFFGAWPLTVTR